jgi:hypothetical protein
VPLDALLLAHARATQEDLPQPRRQILFHTPDGASTSLGSPLLLVPRSRATTKLGFRSRSGRHSPSAATTPCASSAGEAHSPSAATTPRASRSAVAKIFAGLRPRGGYKMRILRGRGTLSLRRHHTSRIQERCRQDLRWPPAARWLQAAHPPRARHTLPPPPPHLAHPGAPSPRSSLASGRVVATSCPSWPPPWRGAQGALQQGRGEVPKALCNKVDWVVEPDATTYRKVCRRHRSPRLAPTDLVPFRVHQPVASEDL